MGSDGYIDASPRLESRPNQLWSQARARCSEMAAAIRKALEADGVKALVHEASPGQTPLFVSMQAWVPAGEVAFGRRDHRVSLKITAQVNHYRESQISYDLEWTTPRPSASPANQSLAGCRSLTPRSAAALALHALGRGPNPLQDEINNRKLTNFLRSFLPLLPDPAKNPLQERYRPRLLTTPVLLVVAAVPLVLVPFVGWIGSIACLIAAARLTNRRQLSVAVAYKPEFEPRRPRLLDAWHAVVPIPGEDLQAVRERLFQAIGPEPAPEARAAPERYGYYGPDGYVEREQLVVQLRQALVYVHIYPFRGELFVGWDAHLNLAQWGETKPVSRRVEGGQVTEYREIGVAAHPPNEYDLIDVNLASELVHRRLKDELRRILEEKRIDEEIDFTIIRGAREGALRDTGAPAETRRQKRAVRAG